MFLDAIASQESQTPTWKAFTNWKIDPYCLLMKNNPLDKSVKLVKDMQK